MCVYIHTHTHIHTLCVRVALTLSLPLSLSLSVGRSSTRAHKQHTLSLSTGTIGEGLPRHPRAGGAGGKP